MQDKTGFDKVGRNRNENENIGLVSAESKPRVYTIETHKH